MEKFQVAEADWPRVTHAIWCNWVHLAAVDDKRRLAFQQELRKLLSNKAETLHQQLAEEFLRAEVRRAGFHLRYKQMLRPSRLIEMVRNPFCDVRPNPVTRPLEPLVADCGTLSFNVASFEIVWTPATGSDLKMSIQECPAWGLLMDALGRNQNV